LKVVSAAPKTIAMLNMSINKKSATMHLKKNDIGLLLSRNLVTSLFTFQKKERNSLMNSST